MNDNQSISQYIGSFNRLFEGPEVDERLKKLVIIKLHFHIECDW